MCSELVANELVRAPRVVLPCSMLEPRMLTVSRGLPRKTVVSHHQLTSSLIKDRLWW